MGNSCSVELMSFDNHKAAQFTVPGYRKIAELWGNMISAK